MSCVRAFLDSTEHTAFELLEEIVNINSFTANPPGVTAVQSRLEAALRPLDLKIERHQREGFGDFLIARSPAAQHATPVLLLGHADTVYPPGTEPALFARDGDFATGPGVMDMKGGLVTIVWALQALHACQKLASIPVVILINCDEETGSIAFRELLELESRSVRAALVFEPGRPNDDIVTRRKGVASWTVTATGRAAHAGNFHQDGQNAIAALARAIIRIESLTDYSQGITLNVGLVAGGSAVNSVPGLARAQFDVRTLSASDYQGIKQTLLGFTGIDVATGAQISLAEDHAWPPLEETSASASLFETYRSFAALAGLSYQRFPTIVGGGSDGNLSSGVGTPTIDGLGPYGEHPHSPFERVKLSSLKPKALNLALYLESLVR